MSSKKSDFGNDDSTVRVSVSAIKPNDTIYSYGVQITHMNDSILECLFEKSDNSVFMVIIKRTH